MADPDLLSSVADADVLIFVLPHAFVPRICAPIKGKIKAGAIAISLIKVNILVVIVFECNDNVLVVWRHRQGFHELPTGGIELISDVIRHSLGIEVSVLMGANLANEVAEGHFCETTIGSKSPKSGALLKDLFQTDNFRVTVVPDVYTVEICGALKVSFGFVVP